MAEPNKKVRAPFKLPDYRVIRPKIFLEEGGKTVAAVSQLSSFALNGCNIEFLTPNTISLFYNKAWKEYEAAQDVFNAVLNPILKPGTTQQINDESLRKLYDYFEHIQTSIISIFSAIEALSNAAIPNDYTLNKTSNKGITETWTKANIERWLPTTEKIGKIVPNILNIESPSMQPFWNDFLVLKDIRDDIIHQKQSKTDPKNIDESFLNKLLNEKVFSQIISGFALVQYFCLKDETHTHFPILKGEIPVDVNIVESFDGLFKVNSVDKN